MTHCACFSPFDITAAVISITGNKCIKMRQVLTRNQIFWTKLRSFKCIFNIYNQQPQVHLWFLTNGSAKLSNFVIWREGEAKTYQKKREFLKELGSSESMRFNNIWPSLIIFKWSIKTVDSWLNSKATSRTLKSLRSHLRTMYYVIKTLMKPCFRDHSERRVSLPTLATKK